MAGAPPKFSARIAEAAAQVAGMSANEVLQELSRVARANMLDYMRVGPDSDPLVNFSRLRRDQAAALIEVTVEHFMDGRGENAREVRRIRFKLANKIGALELLGKHHKLYVERHQHDWGAGLADRLQAAIDRMERVGDHELAGILRGDPPGAGDARVRLARGEETPQEASRSRRSTDRRRRSPRAMTTGRHRQNIARQVQNVAR